MRSVSAAAFVSGPLVLAGYVVGSLTAAWLDLGPDRRAETRRTETGRTETGRAGTGRAGDLVLQAFVAAASSTAAWWTVQELSPGSNFSRIGYLSNQVLSVWQSVALWTGLAVVAGICASVFARFRGGSGLAPTTALAAVYVPWFLVTALAGAGAAYAVTRSARPAHLAAIAALLPTAWLGWVLEWRSAWGLAPGPEVTVWTLVLTIVLGVRWWSDRHPPSL